MAVTAVEQGPVIVAGASRQDFDLVILATGSAAPGWLASAGLAVDGHGFVLVHETLQSVSHPEVFVVGRLRDAARRAAPSLGRLRGASGRNPRANLRNLAAAGRSNATAAGARAGLLSCGPRYAIAQWGGWTAQGQWVWRWKDRIDRGWLRSRGAS